MKLLSKLFLAVMMIMPLAVNSWATPTTPTTLQSAVSADGEGVVYSLSGYKTVFIRVSIGGTAATASFQLDPGTGVYSPLQCQNISSELMSKNTDVSGKFKCDVVGGPSAKLKVPVSRCSACTVTVDAIGNTGNVMGMEPLAIWSDGGGNAGSSSNSTSSYSTTELCDTGGIIPQIGSTTITLVVDSAVTCVVDKTSPANITLSFKSTGRITMTTGKTLTINGQIDSFPVKIFYNALASQGTIRALGQSALAFYCEWWGCVGDGTTDDAPPLQATINAVAVDGGQIQLRSVIYRLASTINLSGSTSNVTIQGVPAGHYNDPTATTASMFRNTVGDMFTLTGNHTFGTAFRDVRFRASAGHIFNLSTFFANRFVFYNVWFLQEDPTKSIVTTTDTPFTYVGEWSFDWVKAQVTTTAIRTAPIFNFVTGVINNIWVTNSIMIANLPDNGNASNYYWKFATTDSGAEARNINFRNVVCESCRGGFISCSSCAANNFDTVSLDDLSSAPDNPIFKFDKWPSNANPSRHNVITNGYSIRNDATNADIFTDTSVSAQGALTLIGGTYGRITLSSGAASVRPAVLIGTKATNVTGSYISMGSGVSQGMGISIVNSDAPPSNYYRLLAGVSGNNDGYFALTQDDVIRLGVDLSGNITFGTSNTSPRGRISPTGNFIVRDAGGANDRAVLAAGSSGNRGVLRLYDATAAAFKYIYIDNGALVISDTDPS